MKRLFYVCLIAFCFLPAVVPLKLATLLAQSAPAAQPATLPPAPLARPVAAISHVLLISVDGLRPDVLLRADTPHMHALYESGTFTFWALTTPNAITLPSHTSMLTGVSPRKHGIEWNADLPLKEPVYPRVPTIFERAHKAGLTTAMAAGKSKFVTLAKPNTLDWCFIPDSVSTSDIEVTSHAVSILRAHRPDFFFVHLPDVDGVGHQYGWGSQRQLLAAADADACLGTILSTLRELQLDSSTLIILSADHGGAGLSHGPDDPRSRYIPWIACGPGIRKNYDLTTDEALTVNTEDSCATAAWFLGLGNPPYMDGKPLKMILENPAALATYGPAGATR